MGFAWGVQVIAIITAMLVILLLIMMILIYRRRNNLIRMGWPVYGKVLDIQERRGARNNKYRISFIEYIHHTQGKTTVQRFSARHSRTYAQGSDVALYYHPEKPQKFVLKTDSTTKVSLIVLGVLAVIVLMLGSYSIYFLLYHTYHA